MATNYVYGALLLHSAGKEINEKNLKTVLTAVDGKADDARIKALTAALDGVNVEEAISKAAVPVVTAAPAASGEKAPAKEGKKKEKESEEDLEKRAETAAAGLGALFG